MQEPGQGPSGKDGVRVVRPGYKRTQAGVIPEEWEEALLGEKAGIYRGGSPRPIQSYSAQSGSGVNWIKSGDVGAGEKYITKTAEKITLEGAARSRRVYAGDLILSNSMSFGRPYVLALDGCIHDGWLVIQDYHDTFCQDFLYYLLSSEFVFQQYAFMAAGSSVQNLNKGKVEALRVVIPSRPEQERIAGALSDADGLISALERLIVKKQSIRQGAVSQLLTGETRLPGFCGVWKSGCVGDIAQPVRGQMLKSTDYVPGPYPVIAGGKSPAGYHNACNRTSVTVTISASGANAGYVALYRTPVFASDCSTISEGTGYCVEYVYYLLQSMQETIYKAQTGGAQPHIHPDDITPLRVRYPADVAEQEAIAALLSDMDRETGALEQELDKARSLRQGMMQQLLTGKIRL